MAAHSWARVLIAAILGLAAGAVFMGMINGDASRPIEPPGGFGLGHDGPPHGGPRRQPPSKPHRPPAESELDGRQQTQTQVSTGLPPSVRPDTVKKEEPGQVPDLGPDSAFVHSLGPAPVPHPSGWTAEEIQAMRDSPDARFDIVYMWVNGSEATYRANRVRYGGAPRANDRDRDNGEFRLSLRSLDMYMPWWNGTLYFLHQNVPCWLNTSHPRLKLIHHRDVFLWQDQTLPTFSSDAIEAFMYRIPGLSRLFVLMNDDYFIGRPVKPQQFVRDGKSLMWFEATTPSASSGMYQSHVRRSYDLVRTLIFGKNSAALPVLFLKHCPCVLDRQRIATLWSTWPEFLTRTVKSRFRAVESIDLTSMHHAHCLAASPGSCEIVPTQEAENDALIFRVGLMGAQDVVRFATRMWFSPPAFFAINDQQSESMANSDVVAREGNFVYRIVLPRLYPIASSWEMNTCEPVRVMPAQ